MTMYIYSYLIVGNLHACMHVCMYVRIELLLQCSSSDYMQLVRPLIPTALIGTIHMSIYVHGPHHVW